MNDFIPTIRGSASIELMAKAAELKQRGIDVIGLGGGDPDFDTPEAIREAAIAAIRRGETHYAVGKGFPALREKIREKLLTENGVDRDTEEIIVTPGAKMAIYLAVRACVNPGDEVLILTPSWVSYAEMVRSAGAVPVSAELSASDNYAIRADFLEKFVSERTKMLIVNTPNNPTGRVMTEEEAKAIVRFAQKRDITVLSDEVYEKIVYEGRKNISLGSFPEISDRVITVNGFSKTYAMTGWRLGYLAADRKYIDPIYKLYSHTSTGTSPFIQAAAIKAFDCGEDVSRMVRTYGERRQAFLSKLKEIPGTEVRFPEGAFYAWVSFDLPGVTDPASFLLERANVIGVPGIAYGETENRYVRFSFANGIDDLLRAAERIGNAVGNRKRGLENA